MTRPAGSRNIPWERIVDELRAKPERWRLFPEMIGVSDRVITTLRRRERRALRLDDGAIRYRRKATTPRADGRIICDVWLRFVPRQTGETPNADAVQGR